MRLKAEYVERKQYSRLSSVHREEARILADEGKDTKASPQEAAKGSCCR
jgi:hypothetical protein